MSVDPGKRREVPSELVQLICDLARRDYLHSVSCPFSDYLLWEGLACIQAERGEKFGQLPQEALTLIATGENVPYLNIRSAGGDAYVEKNSTLHCDLFIVPPGKRLNVTRASPSAPSQLQLVNHCRFVLINRDYGELESARRTSLGYWTFYEAQKELPACNPLRFSASSGAAPTERKDNRYAEEKSLLDRLIRDAKLYRTSAEYRELLDFVVRFRHMAPYNAMLLNVQRPGLRYAATPKDWMSRFGRWPRPAARPLLILKSFAPVEFVYDFLDTEGPDPPPGAFSFPALGDVSAWQVNQMIKRMQKRGIRTVLFDAGDKSAGSISVLRHSKDRKTPSLYNLAFNKNHAPAVQFVTIAHELAHLFLGHLGEDTRLEIKDRRGHSHAQVEVEAESVAYLVSRRNGVEARSESYLHRFAEAAGAIDIYVIMSAVGKIEQILDLNCSLPQNRGSQGQLDL